MDNLKLIFLLCIFLILAGCNKVEDYISGGLPAVINIPSLIPDSYTSIVATRQDAAAEISLTYFDPAWFFKERSYTVYPDYYEVYLSEGRDDNFQMIRKVDTTYINSSFIISGLKNDVVYYIYLKDVYLKDGTTKNSNVAIFIPSAFKPSYQLILRDYYGSNLYSFDWDPQHGKIVYATTYYEYKPGFAAASVFVSLNSTAPFLVDISAWFPAFSHGGEAIAFSSDKYENSSLGFRPEHIVIYEINSGRLITATSGNSVNKYPCYSPDNSRIAFSTSGDSDEQLRIALLDLATLTYRVLQPSLPLEDGESRYSEEHPVWSADGQYIYYTRRDYTPENINPGYFDIYRMRTSGGSPEPVLNTSRIECTPALSPDNSKLAYLTDLNGKLQIWIYDFRENRLYQPFDDSSYSFSEIWSQIRWKDEHTILFSNGIGLFSMTVE